MVHKLDDNEDDNNIATSSLLCVRESEVASDQMVKWDAFWDRSLASIIKTKQAECLPRPKSCEQGHQVCIVPLEDSWGEHV